MSKILSYIKLSRPLNLLQAAIAILVCATIMPRFPGSLQILIAIAIAWAFTGAGNSLNDYYDYEIDKINRPERPIPSGKISRREALVYAVILFLSGLLLTIPIFSIQTGIIVICSMFFLITYSAFFKTRPFWGNFIVSLILGTTFLFAAAIFGDIRIGIPPALLAFGFNLIRELVKDMQDIKGDLTKKAETFPIKFGLDNAKNLAVLLIVILMLGAFLPYILKIYGIYYLICLICTVEIPLLYIIFLLRKDVSPGNCALIASILKSDVFFGLLSIYLGKF